MTKYTREILIDICERAVVKQEYWDDRDTANAQIQLGECWALLQAGCEFEIRTTENQKKTLSCVTTDRTIWLDIEFRGWNWFELALTDEDEKDPAFLETQTFYLPTPERLDSIDDKDWY